MPTYNITVVRGTKTVQISGQIGQSLLDTLIRNDIYISAACGGKGKCGKCGIRMIDGVTEITEDDRRFFSEDELKMGYRLSCLAYPSNDCSLVVASSDEADFEILATESDTTADLSGEYNIAIDIGTTTIAVSLIDAADGDVADTVTVINHQRAYGADVISRIQASVDGKKDQLQASIRRDLTDSIEKLLAKTGVDITAVKTIAIAGNTTMGHLLMGFSCETLGVFPFTPVDISTICRPANDILPALNNAQHVQVILLPGISTYVGADISAGILKCGFDSSDKINVLVDLGTNGEMAIGNKDRIMVTSTAAGPAFEGGNISCGMGSVQGAACQVQIDGTDVTLNTIGNKPPVGLCGTGVIETAYELLKEEWIDETGMLDEDYFDDGFPLGTTPDGEEITFTQKDVREIQLAKSAVRAGLETLILKYGVTYDDIDNLYLAGGFGFRMNLDKAIGIGLLPEEMSDKIQAIGNSSLNGAIEYLSGSNASERMQHIIEISEEVSLASDKNFNQFYTDYMFFE